MVMKNEFDPILRRKLLLRHKKSVENYRWIISHEKELRENYPNKYIAVEDQKVIFVGDNIGEIVSQVKLANREIDDFAIELIREHPTNLLV